jgi:hypothetical protein
VFPDNVRASETNEQVNTDHPSIFAGPVNRQRTKMCAEVLFPLLYGLAFAASNIIVTAEFVAVVDFLVGIGFPYSSTSNGDDFDKFVKSMDCNDLSELTCDNNGSVTAM